MTTAPSVDLDPFDPSFLEDPYPHHHVLRDAGAIVWLPSINAFGMARYAEVKAALTDHQTFCSGRGVGLSDFAKETPSRPVSLLLEVDPPLHDRTRGLMNRIVSLSALRNCRPAWQSVADSLVDDLVRKGQFDGVSELSEAFPLQVFPETIGLRRKGGEHLLTYATSVFNAFGPRNAIFEESQRSAQVAIEWIGESCRRANLLPGGWGMAVFDAADRGECSEAEAERLVRSFLSAGVDTTVNGIAHMLLAFATHPEAWDLSERHELWLAVYSMKACDGTARYKLSFAPPRAKSWSLAFRSPKAARCCYFLRPQTVTLDFGINPNILIRREKMPGTSALDSGCINASVKWSHDKRQR